MRPSAENEAIETLLRRALSEVGLELSDAQGDQLSAHFSLLLEWNRKINLTSVRDPPQIATRHFQESLLLTKLLPLDTISKGGWMVDVGSGAGFPGLPLKVAWPGMRSVLLEPNQKKAAFLKEAARACAIEGLEVRSERVEEAAAGDLRGRASLVTMRAVPVSEKLLDAISCLVKQGGVVALFLGARDAAELARSNRFAWEAPAAIPRSDRRVVLIGHAA